MWETVWDALIIAFALTVAIGDVRWRKIPRVLTTAAVGLGLVFHLLHGGFLSAVAASLIGFGLGLSFFQLGAIGGGDVKLITAMGALLGFDRWLRAMEIAILAAAVIAIAQAIRRGVLRQTLRNVGELVRWLAGKGAVAHPLIQVKNEAMLRAPFGVAAALGTVIAIWRP